jgi:tetrahydromethanopterin S-methyltransferase subunit H
MAGVLVDLIEADFFGIGSGRIQSYRTSNKGKAQKAFPVGTGAIKNTPNATELSHRDAVMGR